MTNNLFKMHALVTPGGTITQIRSRDLNPGIERLLITGDGKIHPEFYGLLSRSPMFNVTTTAVATALGIFGTNAFYSFTTTTAAYMAKLASTGGGYAGSGHAKFTGTTGCVVAKQLSVRHNKEATLTCEMYFLSPDGTTDGFAYTTSAVSLPSLGVASEAFTLGPMKINGTAIAGCTGFDYDFGIRALIKGSGGEVFPTFGGFAVAQPKLTIVGEDAAIWDNVAQAGTAQGGTASSFYLQKISPTGRVAAGTSQHVKCSITAGQFEPEGQRETDEGETEFTVGVYPLFDGTNAIVARSLASAIS
jgi:hypothetical protein